MSTSTSSENPLKPTFLGVGVEDLGALVSSPQSHSKSSSSLNCEEDFGCEVVAVLVEEEELEEDEVEAVEWPEALAAALAACWR